MKLILFATLLLLSFQAKAKPLQFRDLDWTMSMKQMLSVIKKNGLKCTIEPKGWWCEDKSQERRLIYLDDDVIHFFCGTYNGCDYTYLQTVEVITKKYDIEPEYLFDDLYKYWWWEWLGEDGDKIIIRDNRATDWPPSVMLSKGSFGKELDF